MPCDVYLSFNWVIIDSGNGLAPIWCQAITWTNHDLVSILMKFKTKYKTFLSSKFIWKCHLQAGGHFVPASMYSLIDAEWRMSVNKVIIDSDNG